MHTAITLVWVVERQKQWFQQYLAHCLSHPHSDGGEEGRVGVEKGADQRAEVRHFIEFP